MAKARLIRHDIWTSDRFDQLQNNDERMVFFRLFFLADDLGNLEASNATLKATLHPLDIDSIENILLILEKLVDAELIVIYQNNVDGKPKRCIHIPRFNQRVRIKNSDVPPPNFEKQKHNQDVRQTKTVANTTAKPNAALCGTVRHNAAKRSPEVEVEVEVEVKNYIHKILEHLNKVANKNFHYAKTHEKLIKERLKESSFEEIISVIDNQTNLWKHDPKMNQYLKPSTLFRSSNFQNYRGNLKQAESLQVAL